MKGIRFNWKNLIATTLVAALAVSCFGVSQSQAAGRVDLDANVTITVSVDPSATEFGQKYRGAFEVELYKIADLDVAGNATVTTAFANAGIDLSKIGPATSTQDVIDYINTPAADYVAEHHDELTSTTVSGDVTASGFNKSATIENGAGIYLYYVNQTVQDSENDYIFEPAVFYAPTSEYVLTGAGSDTWNYSVTISPKATVEPRFGGLEIEKTLETFNESLGTASFTFSVEGTKDGKLVYSDVVSMNFDSHGTKTRFVSEMIPAGTEVTVTEIRTGASYSLESAASQTVTIVASDVATVSFTNDYDDRLNEGGVSIENHYEKNEDGTGYEFSYSTTNMEEEVLEREVE